MCDLVPTSSFNRQHSVKFLRVGHTCYFNPPKYSKCTVTESKKCTLTANSIRGGDSIPIVSNKFEFQRLEFGSVETRNNGQHQLELETDQKGNELERFHTGSVEVRKTRKELIGRSHIMARQVISIKSALSLGFVSQLWVDANSVSPKHSLHSSLFNWVVIVVEVRPTLLSGDCERFLLRQIIQVGDVILVEDDSSREDEFKFVGLETLVGYKVITPSYQCIGKVRGYTFDLNSGKVEALELDALGITVIPSFLVSTYSVFVEDILEVSEDTIVVNEAAVIDMQRITKGLWDGKLSAKSKTVFEEHQTYRSHKARKRRKNSGSRQLLRSIRRIMDDWELPMDH